MSLSLRPNCRCALLVPTSMGVRITPVNGQPVHCSNTFVMQATSAETNVASVASFLGLPVKVLTTFVKDSPIARFIKDNAVTDVLARHMGDDMQNMLTKLGARVHQGAAGDARAAVTSL